MEGRPEGHGLFGSVEGGDGTELRHASAMGIVESGCHGYAIGGRAVGEPQAVMLGMIEEVAPILPVDRPRYLMGVGTPEDLLEAIARGISELATNQTRRAELIELGKRRAADFSWDRAAQQTLRVYAEVLSGSATHASRPTPHDPRAE